MFDKVVPVRFPKVKMKNLQDTKISADSADSLCIKNPGNGQKVEKTSYY